MPAKQLGPAFPPLSYALQHHGPLSEKCSWLSLLMDDDLQHWWAAAPQRWWWCSWCLASSSRYWSVGRLPQVGFANKTANGVPLEGFYRAVSFWVFNNYLCETLQTVKAPGYKKQVLLVQGKPFLFTEKYHNLFKGHKTSWNMRSKKYLHYSLECPMRPLYKIGISTLKNSTSPGISEELLTQQKVCVVVCGLFAVLWLIMAPEAAGRGWPQRYIKWG